MKEIITIQHTQSFQHINGMVGSWTDWGLTELGKKQAECISQKLASEMNGKTYQIYSSDLLRAKQTAVSLAKYLGLSVTFNENLREINYGEACGKSKQWAREHKLDVTSLDESEYVGAESWRTFWNRVNDAFNEIVVCEKDNIVIIAHGGTLKVIQEIWMGKKLTEYTDYGKSGSVSFLNISDDGIRSVVKLNDMSYMEE